MERSATQLPPETPAALKAFSARNGCHRSLLIIDNYFRPALGTPKSTEAPSSLSGWSVLTKMHLASQIPIDPSSMEALPMASLQQQIDKR